MAEQKAKTALVTGSTDGVGRVVAKLLAQDGMRVLVHGRDRERGEGLVAEIKAAGRLGGIPSLPIYPRSPRCGPGRAGPRK